MAEGEIRLADLAAISRALQDLNTRVARLVRDSQDDELAFDTQDRSAGSTGHLPSQYDPRTRGGHHCIRGAEGPLRGHRHALAAKHHNADLWIAASAMGIDAALLSGDGIFHKVPVQGLTLL
jgi:hypothetical protein